MTREGPGHGCSRRIAHDPAGRRLAPRESRGARPFGRDHRRRRPGAADPVPDRRNQRRRARRDRDRRSRSVGIAHRAPAGGRGRSAPGDGLLAQWPLSEDGKDRCVARAQPGDGHVPGQERPMELYPRQFPESPRRRAERARLRRRPRGSEKGGRQMGRARIGRGDHRRQGRRRHGAQHGRMGQAPAGHGDRLACR